MAYSKFTLTQLETEFQIHLVEDQHLYPNITEVILPHALTDLLAYYVPMATAISTEKARSELIVAPILVELRRLTHEQISLFSGIEFNVDRKKGLTGACDFLISRSSNQFYLTAPVITLVEAKNNNLKDGLPQCMAEMIAAQIFNHKRNVTIDTIYGVVTTGSIWRFLHLIDKTVYIDKDEYYLNDLSKIMAILLTMSQGT